MTLKNTGQSKKVRDPRQEKLRDFRHRGNHPHGYGVKACGQCGIEYRKWRRKHRLDSKRSLRECLLSLSDLNHS